LGMGHGWGTHKGALRRWSTFSRQWIEIAIVPSFFYNRH
jgi:hypothetical protein